MALQFKAFDAKFVETKSHVIATREEAYHLGMQSVFEGGGYELRLVDDNEIAAIIATDNKKPITNRSIV